MIVYTDLHMHESGASADSRTPASSMVRAAHNKLGDFVMIGFVGHDDRPSVGAQAPLTITGVEKELRKPPRQLHVLEFPRFNFRVLAHPRTTWPDRTIEHVNQFLNENPDIDAVEKFRGGVRQYRGSVDALELAGSDAHNPLSVGSSAMAVETQDVSREGVMRAIQRGDFRVVNNLPSVLEHLVTSIEKSTTLLWREPHTAIRVGTSRVGLKSKTPE